ncbi:MAG: hypothetical protein ACRC6I_20465, partial [Paracoccaceae bacterium]
EGAWNVLGRGVEGGIRGVAEFPKKYKSFLRGSYFLLFGRYLLVFPSIRRSFLVSILSSFVAFVFVFRTIVGAEYAFPNQGGVFLGGLGFFLAENEFLLGFLVAQYLIDYIVLILVFSFFRSGERSFIKSSLFFASVPLFIFIGSVFVSLLISFVPISTESEWINFLQTAPVSLIFKSSYFYSVNALLNPFTFSIGYFYDSSGLPNELFGDILFFSFFSSLFYYSALFSATLALLFIGSDAIVNVLNSVARSTVFVKFWLFSLGYDKEPTKLASLLCLMIWTAVFVTYQLFLYVKW